MRTSLKFFLLAAVVCVAAISCSKDSGGNTKIKAGISEFGTKITIEESGDKFQLRWKAGDKLIVENADHATSVFSITNGPGEMGPGYQNAVFWGEALSGASFKTFYSVSPGTYDTFDKLENFSYSAQAQTGNSSTAHLESYYCAYQENASSYSTISFDPNKSGVHTSSLLKIKVKLPADEAAGNVTRLQFYSFEQEKVFHTTNKNDSETATDVLTLPLSNIAKETKTALTLTAYMMTSWQPIVFTKDKYYEIAVWLGDDYTVYDNCYYMRFKIKETITVKGGAYLIDLTTKDMSQDRQSFDGASAPGLTPKNLDDLPEAAQ